MPATRLPPISSTHAQAARRLAPPPRHQVAPTTSRQCPATKEAPSHLWAYLRGPLPGNYDSHAPPAVHRGPWHQPPHCHPIRCNPSCHSRNYSHGIRGNCRHRHHLQGSHHRPCCHPTCRPTDPTCHPSDPTCRPTLPTCRPNDPTCRPTDPSCQPTGPTCRPTNPTC